VKKIILIAQGTVEARKRILQALEPLYDEGYYLLTCNSGDDLLKKIPLGTPSLIFIDLPLPGRNGFELLNFIRNNPRTSDVPIVVLVSPTQGIFKLTSLGLKSTLFINRPASNGKILELAKTCLEEAR